MNTRKITRRRLLAAGGSLGALGVIGGIDAFAIEPNWLDINCMQLAIDGLPSSLEGFTIAQVTDAHLTNLGLVEAAVIREIERTRPQVVVLTGDLIDHARDFAVLQEFCWALRNSGARIVATLGNWEHWGRLNLHDLAKRYSQASARLLVDEALSIDGVHFWGTDDSTAGVPKRPNLRAAAPRVLLSHSPAFLDTARPDGPPFHLALAGHTHGGQIRLGERLIPFLPPGSGRFVAGHYQTPVGPSYISRGTGTSIVPARFTCLPELPIFELIRA